MVGVTVASSDNVAVQKKAASHTIVASTSHTAKTSTRPEGEISVSVVYSNVKIRGKPVNPEKRYKNNQLQKKAGGVRKEPNSLEPSKQYGQGTTNKKKLAMKYLKKWRSKTIYQVLLEYRAEMFREFSNFSQQVHLYNQHVNYFISSNKRQERVEMRRIDSNQTYKKFIGAPKPIALRIPFKLRHKSTFAPDLNFDSYASSSKSVLHEKQENWEKPFKPLQKEERLNHELGIQANSNSENVFDEEEDEDTVYFYHSKTGAIERKSKYAIGHLGKSISVASIQSEQFDRMEEVEIDYLVPASSFGKVFMQLMCPSCCGGLFSETKGSVYMKRAPTRRVSKSKSVSSSVSDLMMDGYEDNKEMQFHTTNRTLTPIPEHQDKPLSPTTTVESEGKSKEVRSVSLGDALCQEFNQNKSDDGKIDWNTKLRKTSLPTGEFEQNKLKENTVIELKIRGKEHVEVVKQNGNEDPPFNFQAILRKTSTTRSSLIRKTDKKCDNYFKTELLPGVILQGVIYDL